MIKTFFWLCLSIIVLHASENKTRLHLQIEQGGILSTKIIHSALITMGFKVDIERFNLSEGLNEMDLTLSGRKPYDPQWFAETLMEHQITLLKKEMKNKVWSITLDASSARWNLQPINEDESATLARSFNPYWFTIDQANMIEIQAPYGIKWYPEVAILDENMQVLLSQKESKPYDTFTLKLPPNSKYLKVSNANGMKILKEGLWVENMNEEQ